MVDVKNGLFSNDCIIQKKIIKEISNHFDVDYTLVILFSYLLIKWKRTLFFIRSVSADVVSWMNLLHRHKSISLMHEVFVWISHVTPKKKRKFLNHEVVVSKKTVSLFSDIKWSYTRLIIFKHDTIK